MNIVFMSCLQCTALILSVAHGPIGLLRIKVFVSILSYLLYLSYPLGDWIHFVEFFARFYKGRHFLCDFLLVFSSPVRSTRRAIVVTPVVCVCVCVPVPVTLR